MPKKIAPIRIKLSTYLLLALIFGLGLALRLFWLDKAPAGALIDEAHFGYLAYSLLETGKDEHGVSWPLIFKGFGDQKLPAYAYTLMPFVQLFGLSVITIRLPSAIAGSLLIVLLFFLVRKITKSDSVGLAAATLTAFSPWPFFLSRIGFESNLALFFWVIALNGFVRIKDGTKWAVVAGVATALTWYSYIAYRPVTLLMIAIIAVYLWFQDKKLRKRVLVLLVSFGILVSPFILLPNSANSTRLQQVGIFYDKGIIAEVDEQRTFCSDRAPQKLCYAVFNKATVILPVLFNRYIETFSPEYLGSFGEKTERFLTVHRTGQFFTFLYPFFIIGIFAFLSSTQQPTLNKILFASGLLLSPIPAVIAGDMQKVRGSILLPFVIIAIAYGIYRTYLFIFSLPFVQKQTKLLMPSKLLIIAGSLGIFTLAGLYYFATFYTVHAAKNDFMYQSYVRELMTKVQEFRTEGRHVYLVPRYSDPIMFYAFYTKMDPAEYQRQAVLGDLEPSGFHHTVGIDGITVTEEGFSSIACVAVRENIPSVYVTNEQLPSVEPMQSIRSTNGALQYLYLYDALKYGESIAEQCQSS